MIELLVVIGIIGVLLAVLLPTLRGAREQANRVACMNNLRVMGQCSQMYVDEFKGVLPWEGYAEGDRDIRNVGRWEDWSQWFNVAGHYSKLPTYNELQLADAAGTRPLPKAGDKSLYVCPDSQEPSKGIKDDLVQDGYLMLWGLDDQNNIDRRKTYWSYAYNIQLDGGVEDRNVGYRVCLKQNQIHQPALTVLLLERIMSPLEFTPAWTSGVGCSATSWTRFTTRHGGGGFILMCDGHVQYFKRTAVLTPPHYPDYNQPAEIIWNPQGPTN